MGVFFFWLNVNTINIVSYNNKFLCTEDNFRCLLINIPVDEFRCVAQLFNLNKRWKGRFELCKYEITENLSVGGTVGQSQVWGEQDVFVEMI